MGRQTTLARAQTGGAGIHSAGTIPAGTPVGYSGSSRGLVPSDRAVRDQRVDMVELGGQTRKGGPDAQQCGVGGMRRGIAHSFAVTRGTLPSRVSWPRASVDSS